MNYMEKCYGRNSPIISKTISDELVLVPIKDEVGDLGKVYIIKGIGRDIWELIDGKRSVREIKRLLLKEYKVSQIEIEKDLLLFLKELKEKGCIKEI